MNHLLLSAVLLFFSLSLIGQEAFDFAANKKSMKIPSTTDKINVDGELSEPISVTTERYGNFYQQSPLDAVLAEQITEVQLVYDTNISISQPPV